MARSKKKSKKLKKGKKKNDLPLKIACTSLLFLFLPLLFSRATQDPLTPIRWLFLSIFTISFVAFFPLWRREQFDFSHHIKELKLYLIAALSFIIWGLVSASTSINLSSSCQELLKFLLVPILVYIIYHTYLQEKGKFQWLYRAIAVAAGIQGLVALGQGWGLEGLLTIPGRGGKIYGLMANGNLLGSAQVASLPFVWLATLDKNRRWSLFGKIAMVLTVCSIVIAASRSPWLAMIAATVPLLAVIYLRRQSLPDYLSSLRSSGWIFGLVALVLTASVVLTNDRVGRSIISRVAPTSEAIADDKLAIQAKENISGRLEMWSLAAAKIAEHPIIGIGPGNWKIMSPLYEAENALGAQSGAKNLRPHNVYLQVANEYGLPGLLFFLFMGLIPAILCLRHLATADTDNALALAAMLGVLLALATDFMFSFSHERISHMSLMALATGVIFGLSTKSKQVLKTSSVQTAAWIGTLILSLTSLYTVSERWKFENHWLRAKAYLDAGNNEQSLLEADKGKSALVKIGPIANTMEVNKAQALKNLGRMDEAVATSHEGLKKHPYNFALINNLGTIFFQSKQYDSAGHYFNKALKLHPADPIVLKNLASTYFNKGAYEQCIIAIDALDEKERDAQILSLRSEAARRSN